MGREALHFAFRRGRVSTGRPSGTTSAGLHELGTAAAYRSLCQTGISVTH